MPCTSARPAGPRNPNRSLLSVRDSPLTWILSLSLFLSDSRSLSLSLFPCHHRVPCFQPTDPSFTASTEMTSVLSPRVRRDDRPSTISHVDASIGAAGRAVNYFAVLGRRQSRASLRRNIYAPLALGHDLEQNMSSSQESVERAIVIFSYALFSCDLLMKFCFSDSKRFKINQSNTFFFKDMQKRYFSIFDLENFVKCVSFLRKK